MPGSPNDAFDHANKKKDHVPPKQTRTIRNEPNKLAKSKFPSPAKDLIMMRTHGRAFEGKVEATRTSMEENNRDLSWK